MLYKSGGKDTNNIPLSNHNRQIFLTLPAFYVDCFLADGGIWGAYFGVAGGLLVIFPGLGG